MKGEHRFPGLVSILMLTAALFAACTDGMTDPDLNAPSAVHNSTGSTDSLGGTTMGSTCSGNVAEGCYIEGETCNLTDAFQSCHEQEGGSYGGGSGGGGTGGSGGGGTGGSGSGTTSYDTPTGEPVANDETWDCDTTKDPRCDLQDPTQAQRDQAQAETNKIKDDGICGQAKSMAQTMLNTAGGFQVWTNKIQQTNPQTGLPETVLGDQTIKYLHATGVEHIKVMHLWTQGGINAWTIAHEALHALGGSHNTTYTNPDGRARDLDGTAKFCSGS